MGDALPSIKKCAREAACFAFSNNVSVKLKVILIGFAAFGKKRLAALHHTGSDRNTESVFNLAWISC